MTIFGLTGAEVMMLERWALMTRQHKVLVTPEQPFADIYALREQWIAAGGTFPVRECDIVFAKPLSPERGKVEA